MRLEKFMFCMTVETIGLAIGYFGVYTYGLELLLLIGVHMLFLFMRYNLGEQYTEREIDFDTIHVIITSAVLSALIYMNILLIKGIRNVSHFSLLN